MISLNKMMMDDAEDVYNFIFFDGRDSYYNCNKNNYYVDPSYTFVCDNRNVITKCIKIGVCVRTYDDILKEYLR